MKILNRQQFLALTGPVLYAKYEPCISTSDLSIKYPNDMPNDFVYVDLVIGSVSAKGQDDLVDMVGAAVLPDVSIEMDFDSTMRDGCFDKDQLFAVYEKADVQKLINKLQEVVNGPDQI
jgi:hypothetical protein